MDKAKQSDELLLRIRNELTAILEENNSNDPKRRISYEDLMKPTPLPSLEPSKNKKKKTSSKLQIYHNPQSHRQSIGGKSITMKPSNTRLSAGQKPSSEELSSSTSIGTSSATSFRDMVPTLDHSLTAEFLESQSAKSIDEDMQKMQRNLCTSFLRALLS